MGETTEGFRQRARHEAGRYGSDPWVFVRELLQNARDAGAGEVRFRVETADGRDRVVCRDDGEGMTLDHAKRYLFTLYASSKADDEATAGRFGIGFWSVLRFEPALIVVRSRPAEEDGWEVSIDGGFRSVRQRSLVMQKGTEIVLERPASGDDPAASVIAAIRADCRRLAMRDDPSERVTVVVNDEVVETEPVLKSPNVTMDEPGLHVAVALEENPRVDVYAHGLRVRTTAFLDELLAAEPARGPAGVELPDGLVPRIVLDSRRLEVLMARADTRENDELRHMVRRAEREVELLVNEELEHIAARPPLVRWMERLGYAVGGVRNAAFLAALLAVSGATVLAGWWWMGRESKAPFAEISQPGAIDGTSTQRPVTPTDSSRPYLDLAAVYAGPAVDAMVQTPALELSYRPVTAEPLFTGLRVGGIGPDGTPAVATEPENPGPYEGVTCDDGCLEVELRFAAGPGWMRVPVASGHRIDVATVTLDDRPGTLFVNEYGEPLLRLDDAREGILRYLSGPAPALVPPAVSAWPPVPPTLETPARALEGLTPAARVSTAIDVIRGRVAYDRSAEAVTRMERAVGATDDVFEAALTAGVGDCDVQNALLAAVLHRTGLPSWLAVGMVGSNGRARPGLHAWVEYLSDGWWQVADASGGWQPLGDGSVEPAEDLAVAPAPADERPVGDGSEVAGTGLPRALPLWALGVVLIAVLGAAVALAVRWSRKPRRVVVSEGTANLARLLRGALLRPRAYRGVGALFSRPLIPLVSGRRLSLPAAVERARAGRLFRGTPDTDPVQRAIRHRDAVIDVELDEGAAVADLLGARDLDPWQGIAERMESNPATEAAESELRLTGQRWKIRVAEDPPQRVSILENHILGLGGRGRVAVVDSSGLLWETVSRDVEGAPAWAAFVLADGIAPAIDLKSADRRRWLTSLARAAVLESSGDSA